MGEKTKEGKEIVKFMDTVDHLLPLDNSRGSFASMSKDWIRAERIARAVEILSDSSQGGFNRNVGVPTLTPEQQNFIINYAEAKTEETKKEYETSMAFQTLKLFEKEIANRERVVQALEVAEASLARIRKVLGQIT